MNSIPLSFENLEAHELIGLEVISERAGQKIKGKVIDETMNVLVIETANGEKRVPKKEALFEFKAGGIKKTVNGKDLSFRPEDRTKMFWRKNHGK